MAMSLSTEQTGQGAGQQDRAFRDGLVMSARRLFFMLAGLLGLLWMATPAYAQDLVKVRAGSQTDQGRIVFDWPISVTSDAKIEGRQLTITFSRKATFDVSAVANAIPGYVTGASLGEDGQTVRFQLSGDFRLSRFANGTAVVVDLLGPPVKSNTPAPVVAAPVTPTPAPAPPPQAPPKAAPTPLKPKVAPPVTGDMILQIGQQAAFTRLSFIWPSPPPPYNVTKTGNAISVTFDRLTQVDMGRAETESARYLRDVRVFNRSGKTVVVLNVAPGTGSRDFAEDNTVVVDLIGGKIGTSSGPAPVEPESKQIASDEKARSERAAQTSPAAGQNFDPDIGPLPERLTTPALAQAQRADAERRALAAATAANPQAAAKPAEAAAEAAPTAPGARKPSTGEEKKPSAAPRPPVMTQPLPATPSGSVGTVVVGLENQGDHTRLVFPFPVRTPAAAFTRAGVVWVVFDAQSTLDTKAVAAAPYKVRQMNTPRGTVAQFAPQEGRAIDISLDGNTWFIDLVSQPPPGEPIEIIPRPNSPGGSDILLQILEHGDIHHLNDNVVGDRLDIATTIRPDHGIATTHNFLGFDLWPTQQGAVVVPQIDAIQTLPDPEGVKITQEGGLLLSNGLRPTEQAMKGAGGSPGAEAFVEYDKWARQNEGPFKRVRARLERTSALAPKLLKNTSRLELARFFLANHFDAEALGVLNLMASTDEALENDPAFLALRGIAKTGVYRAKEALPDLSTPALKLDNNAALWRGMADSLIQDWPAAAGEFRRGLPLLERYPLKERMKFRMASARANIEIGDKDAAGKDLADVVKNKPGPPDSFRAYYLGARIRELNNDISGALLDYDRAIGGSDRQSKANSRYRKILLQERAGKLTPAAAIEALETLRYTWRGDDLERDILRSLGLYYIKAGDYRAGFDTMRTAMSMFADSRQAQEIRDDMNRVFTDLYLRGGANTMSPVKALGLYYDFRELTPVGNEGDEMIRRLADRMVSVDLLPQAAELLRHQVEKRLAGTAQALVSARLAVVYLLDKKPAEALQVLEKTQQIQLPPAISAERNRLRARALMELGKTVDATNAISDDRSTDAKYLRADILWSGQQWAESGEKIEELLAPVKPPEAKLDAMSQSLILRASISYALAGDRVNLNKLAGIFGPRMAKTNDAASFVALTSSSDITNTEFRQLASKIASTKTYESFLTAYRERIRTGGLNAIN